MGSMGHTTRQDRNVRACHQWSNAVYIQVGIHYSMSVKFWPILKSEGQKKDVSIKDNKCVCCCESNCRLYKEHEFNT